MVQKVHPEQRYAVINVHNGLTTFVKVVAIDKCGQVSDFSQIFISPMNRSGSDEETAVTVTTATVTDHDYTTTTARDSQGISSTTLSLMLTGSIVLTALISMSLAILCTLILIRHRLHPVSDSDTGRVRTLNIDCSL